MFQTPKIGGWGYLNTDERHALSAGYFFFAMGDDYGSKVRNINPYIQYRPASYLTTMIGVNLNWNVDDSQWVDQVGPHYVFGHLDQDTVGLNMRLNYSITPALTAIDT